MNINSRKKQIKPKVTIDQNKDDRSVFKKFKQRFLDILSIFSKKKLFLFGVLLISILLLFLYIPNIQNLTSLRIMDNSFINDQKQKISEIESNIVNNNERLDLLQEKDQHLLNLEVKIFELNTKIKEISEENNLITQKNNELIEHIKIIADKPSKEIKLKEESFGAGEELINNNEDLSNIDEIDNNLRKIDKIEDSIIDKEIDPKKVNLVSLIIKRIEESVIFKEDFDDEIELLVSLNINYENMDELRDLSTKRIATPEEIIRDLDEYLKENINLYKGDNKFKSKFFEILSKEVNVARLNYSENVSLIEELKSNIYNDDLTNAMSIIRKTEFSEDLIDLSKNIELRSLYLNEIKYLKHKFENN
tara:strand:- start:4653 stop:5741 length:1089 start_codon:yes stop_codon:yes gene_type:complete